MARAQRTPASGVAPFPVGPPPVVLTTDLPHLVGDVEVIALPVLTASGDADGPLLGPGAADVVELLGLDLTDVVESAKATGAAGEVVSVPVAAPAAAPALRLVILLGVGSASRDDLRRASAALARAVRRRDVVATTLGSLDPAALDAVVAGLVLGSFVFEWRSSAPEQPPAARFVLAGLDQSDQAALDRGHAIASAAWTSRELAATPANVASPAWLADRAVAAAKAAGLKTTVWDEKRLVAEGFGGILGIGQASAVPPRLVRMDYAPRRRGNRGSSGGSNRPIVLIGKGVTFDSGGLSIKPGESMAHMKRDMTGGGAVIATMAQLAAVDCRHPVVGLIPMVENAISGNAIRPGDVVTHFGGRTTEVNNTDAEGRVILADAMAYAVAELDPVAIVDIATLTGAIKVALGDQVGGLFANDDALAATLRDAGDVAGEPMWRMPLATAYEEKLASKVADADNAAGGPGAITAALFLQHFVGGLPWAHLDIASVGDRAADAYEWSAGPTGFGARLLLQWLSDPDPLRGVGAVTAGAR